ncbi:xylose ABC transporter [Paenibacillus pini JCM 16418]|uniref:Xylose ABC transporter n=1 Tax=Paenibacillus pini JCM 16418 TaxID=1236976 RepID=W7YFQ5_9BACL|nr:xylose ABC transporter [Paenibacillus pini JCM 16418]
MEVSTVQQVNPGDIKHKKRKKGYKQPWVLHFMVLPAAILVFIFSYIPMTGIIMAFQDYKPALGVSESLGSA